MTDVYEPNFQGGNNKIGGVSKIYTKEQTIINT